ncbi:uridine-cytidine kinase 2-B-like [Styela clava]|uniref:uridine-cytidine kinase 2-B-like n=1 Tax=Styela clava TaxID=7725 RepID=UPI0019392A0D|nr:uridine-cytidine kinase 2-B-like [Styela clava]
MDSSSLVDMVQSPCPFIIGVSGGTSSGKTSVCQKIIQCLKETSMSKWGKVAIISQDDFYRELTSEQIALANKSQYNFDHPDAFDTKLMKKTLSELVQGKTVKLPKYDFKTHSRLKDEWTELGRCDVILFEGILVFYHKEIREMFNMKLFVDSDADTRLSRRVLRDISERGRELESVLHQYTTFVKPAFEEFCMPTKKYADVIIPRGHENTVAINLIVQHIRDILTGGVRRRQNGHVTNGSGDHSHMNGHAKAVNGLVGVLPSQEIANGTSRPH